MNSEVIRKESVDLKSTRKIENGFVVLKPSEIKVTYGLLEGEQLYECPYNPSHQILDPKWMTHLQRCRKNGLSRFKGLEQDFPIKVCPYESNFHHVPADVFELHKQSCPSKPKMDALLSSFSAIRMKTETKTAIVNQRDNDQNDWENESSGSKPWMWQPSSQRPLPLSTKSEKKKFYEDYKLRQSSALKNGRLGGSDGNESMYDSDSLLMGDDDADNLSSCDVSTEDFTDERKTKSLGDPWWVNRM